MTFPDIHRFPVIALDTETFVLKWWEHPRPVFGIVLAHPDPVDGEKAHYWDVRHHAGVIEWLARELPRYRGRIAFHNAKFDIHVLRQMGVRVPVTQVDCTMIRAALLDEHRLSYDLDSVAMDCCGIGKDNSIYQKLADLFGGPATKKAQMPNLHRAPWQVAAQYGKQDGIATLRLWQYQEGPLDDQDLRRVETVERNLLEAIIDMEYRGVRVDVAQAEKAERQLAREIAKQQKALDRMAGFPVNVNPSTSLKKLIAPRRLADGSWVAKDGTPLESTAAGKPSISADALRAMKMPEAGLVLQLRQLRKTRETFILGHILGHHHDGVIHANFNQTKSDNNRGTGTGRLSCNDPALQQIHKRNAVIAAIVRSIFIPDAGQNWHCRDWSQMDFRVFAHYAQVPAILQRYAEDPDTDFHAIVAQLVGIPRNAKEALEQGVKGNAKQINLGNVFGMGPGKMAAEMGLPFEVVEGRHKKYLKPGPEAEELFAKYHRAVPGIKELLQRAESVAKSRGYVKTALGRRIRFPRRSEAYKAGGLIFQGSAADALKVKLYEVYKELQGTEARLLLNVHDEFDMSMPPGYDHVAKRVGEIVESFGPNDVIHFTVPIRSDEGVGPNWWIASK